MSVATEHLAEAQRRERSAERRAERERYQLNPAELMRGCAYAARAVTRNVPSVSDDERDALAQMVALRVLEGGAERGEAGREYLRRAALTCMERSDDWRDLAGSYRGARERSRGEQPTTFQIEGASEGGWLAAALGRESERQGTERPASLPEDLREIARAMAESEARELAADGYGSAAKREGELYAALLARLPDPKSGKVPSGVTIAAHLAISHDAMRKRVSRGSALWRERYSAPALARLIRATGAALGAERGEGEPHAWRAARAAVESVQAERKRDGAPRGPYSPATARAARRNLRAERATGRYGATYPDTLPSATGKHRIAALGSVPTPTRAERKRKLAAQARRTRAASAACRERRIRFRAEHPFGDMLPPVTNG